MMTLSGLTGCPLRYKLQIPACSPVYRERASLSSPVQSVEFFCKQRGSSNWATSTQRCGLRRIPLVRCTMDASSYGDAANGSSAIFPRINVRDPYKLLGISREASADEIQSARIFLIQRYGDHKPSVDAIESAHNKIIMQKFNERKNPKLNIKKKFREITQSRYVQAVTSRFRTPPTSLIIKTSITFVLLGVLTVLFPTEEGPTVQVALSLIITMYLIYDRLKSKLWAFAYGAGTFVLSWFVGTFLMVSVIPPIFKGLRSLEVTTSLISYVFLWIASTYLR
nr:protein CHAPERONE-LIKE PROTEIN OF POR1, chloroplastic-like [Coffea arabica]XP_027074792.1 protein CHAPERONE-LIKE PROTEIN OF POR1, chloroplastic-like [Coffea arabica]XP_027074793.1 protein CHAPERONE-LIKE PROTEIN OF POR1, chloroplastic-like [Coffea arabica]XP_027074794.1 protein CHAPERONE-LIKE PROTEIN OF POR1, chloroplastic-like [Coffea arabica]XP_027074795.1 protein CHAPERONE-LIKE PROTEIN OF POR1, chloroplastic-like [Coffea arabica]XP_027078404.1 protein CHAPERONE-LIKE PROTEIN OF POR1, chlor